MAMKFRAHDTFFIRRGWLSKGMKHVKQNGEVFISKEENPMDVLGIGANMVKALRYWMQAVKLTEERKKGRRVQRLTTFGEKVFKNDRYIEEIGTLHLLHYNLVSNKELATAWYFFFNKFSMSEFTKDDFIVVLKNFIKAENEKLIAHRSLNDDFDCIINTYLPRYKLNPSKVSPENNIDCPFGELGLIDILDKSKKLYKKSTPLVDTFNPWVVVAIIVDQANKANKGKQISLNELLTAPCNIGRVFNLDAISMLEILHKAEKTGEIKIVRTAGLDTVNIINNPTFEKCVEIYYESIEQ